MNYEEILSRFTYEDEAGIMERIALADNANYRENKDIINQIILWKMNRTPEIDNELIDMIYGLNDMKTPVMAVESEKVKRTVEKLLRTKGMKLPMASTVLHFYFPDVYPIIDQRAYRELYGEEYPRYVGKIEIMVEVYMKYIADTYHYQQENCPDIPFAKIDKVLYQLDKEKGYKVVY